MSADHTGDLEEWLAFLLERLVIQSAQVLQHFEQVRVHKPGVITYVGKHPKWCEPFANLTPCHKRNVLPSERLAFNWKLQLHHTRHDKVAHQKVQDCSTVSAACSAIHCCVAKLPRRMSHTRSLQQHFSLRCCVGYRPHHIVRHNKHSRISGNEEVCDTGTIDVRQTLCCSTILDTESTRNGGSSLGHGGASWPIVPLHTTWRTSSMDKK